MCRCSQRMPRCSAEQAGDGRGQQEDVHGVDAGDDAARGELAAEHDGGQPRAQERDGLRDGVRHAQAGAREQVVGERVAEQAVAGHQQQEREPDEPVDHARLAVGAGEEHAQQVDHEGGHEDQRGPVVHLPHEQAGAHVEAQVHHGAVGVRHGHAGERLVGALVHHLGLRGVEEQGQEGAGDHEQDEAVQGDLAEEEGPAVREDVAELLLEQPAAAAEVAVRPARRRAQRRAAHAEGGAEALHEAALAERCASGAPLVSSSTLAVHPAFQKPGPTGSVKSLWA